MLRLQGMDGTAGSRSWRERCRCPWTTLVLVVVAGLLPVVADGGGGRSGGAVVVLLEAALPRPPLLRAQAMTIWLWRALRARMGMRI